MEFSNKEIIRYVTTDCSPSHLPNNMTLSKKHVFYIHNSETQPRVIMIDREYKIILKSLKYFIKKKNIFFYYFNRLLKEVDPTQDLITKNVSKLSNTEDNEMLRVKVLDLNGTLVSAIGLYGGLKLYSYDGSRLFFNIPCKIKQLEKPYLFQAISEYYNYGNNTPAEEPKFKGYPCHGILCADSYGQIFLISGSNLNYKSKLLYHNIGITATDIICDYKTGIFSCAFETGEIYVLKIKDENIVENLIKFDNIDNLPCLSLSNLYTKKYNYLAAAYLNGEIRVYLNKYSAMNKGNNEKGFDFVYSIFSNLRMINSLCSYNNYLASCSDDCFINIWRINDNGEINIIGNYEISDKMPLAAEFSLNSNGKMNLIATCFDTPSLTLIEGLNLN